MVWPGDGLPYATLQPIGFVPFEDRPCAHRESARDILTPMETETAQRLDTMWQPR